MTNSLYGSVMRGDMGGDYESVKGVSNDALKSTESKIP